MIAGTPTFFYTLSHHCFHSFDAFLQPLHFRINTRIFPIIRFLENIFKLQIAQ